MESTSDLVGRVMQKALAGASLDEIQREALAAKFKLTENYWELMRAVHAIDGIIGVYGWSPDWVTGWPQAEPPASVEPTASAPASEKKRTRAEQIVDAAFRLSAEAGTPTVNSDDLAERLRASASEFSRMEMRSLLISIGNTLQRAGWDRVEAGVYERPDSVVEVDATDLNLQ